MWRGVIVTVAVLAASWLMLLAFVLIARPGRDALRVLPRLLPETIGLIRGLATDPAVSRTARLPVWGLLAYLATPIDLVPDFIPVVGHADDVILVALVLRRLFRQAGTAKVMEHWPGHPEDLARLERILGLASR